MISKTLLADEKGHSPDLRTPCDRSSAVLFWAEFFDFNPQTFVTSAVLQLIIPSVNSDILTRCELFRIGTLAQQPSSCLHVGSDDELSKV